MIIGIDGEVFTGKRNGVRRYAMSLLEHLLKIDHENEYVIYLHKPMNIHFFDNDDYRIKVINLPRLVWKSFLFTHLLDKDKIDIFHSLAYSLPIVPRLLRRVKLVTTFHGLHWEYCKWPLHEKVPWIMLFRSSAKVADAVVSVSETLKKEIHEKYGISLSKIYVTYPGVSQEFKPIKQDERLFYHKQLALKYGLPSKTYALYSGAGLRPNKNLTTLLRAWKILSKDYSVEIPLVVTRVGSSSFFNDLLKSLNLRSNVIHLEWVDEKDIPYVYSCALFSVYPSTYEGFGSPPLESMACGTPAIVSNASAMPEIVGNAALLVKNPLNPYEWAEKVLMIIRSENLRKDLIKRGLLHARAFSWDKTAKSTLAIYKKITSEA